MGQAQKKQEQSGPVRTSPPPLPRRSGVAPVAAADKPRATPPPPPAAALRISRPPRISLPAPAPSAPVHLALLPQWEDANASLRPAPKKSNKLLYWLGSVTLSLGAGALVAAGLTNVRLSDFAPHAQSEQVVATQLTPVQIAQVTDKVAHVEEFTLEDAIAINAAPAKAAPVEIPMLTVTSKLAAKPSKRGQSLKKSKKRAEAKQLTAAQPDPRDEAEVETAPEAETVEAAAADTTEAQEPSEAAVAPVSEPEAPAAVEPQAPALPEKLTRDQVRGGLDALRSQVLACTNGTYGKILADVTISAPGRVSHSVIEGTFAGTNAGSCMARVLRTAQFPAFSGPEISVRYPFSF